MPLIPLVLDLLLFLGVVLGLGLPWVLRTRLDPVEKLALGAGVGVFQIYAVAWIVYWTNLPVTAFLALPLLAVVASLTWFRPLRDFLAASEVRGLLGRQLLFTVWCTLWLALVRSYGGGEWSGDWHEHYERARFFLDHDPLEKIFLIVYSLPARPPLANLVDGALMGVGGTDFASFQLFNTFFSTLIFLPAVLLVRHFARGRQPGDAALLLMLMLNPLVVENATFSWTKLLTAFFILLAIAFYVRGLGDPGPERRTIAVGAVAVALLAHYSAGPFAVGLALAQLAFVWSRRQQPARWREFALQGLLAVALLATWFAWSIHSYGAHTTFLSNTTATGDAVSSPAERINVRIWNTFVTVVPHPLRPTDYRFIAQTSRLGFLRDYFFNIYQTTLPGAFGLAGLWLLAWFIRHRRPAAIAGPERWFWRCFPIGVILLGIATASWRDRWGVAHICLPAIIITGLAWLAARLPETPANVRRWWMLALGLDLGFGIALHFYLQFIMRLEPNALVGLAQNRVLEFSHSATKNMLQELIAGYDFVIDGGLSPILLVALLIMLLALAVSQVFSALREVPRQSPR
jgi:hypothetical protein